MDINTIRELQRIHEISGSLLHRVGRDAQEASSIALSTEKSPSFAGRADAPPASSVSKTRGHTSTASTSRRQPAAASDSSAGGGLTLSRLTSTPSGVKVFANAAPSQSSSRVHRAVDAEATPKPTAAPALRELTEIESVKKAAASLLQDFRSPFLDDASGSGSGSSSGYSSKPQSPLSMSTPTPRPAKTSVKSAPTDSTDAEGLREDLNTPPVVPRDPEDEDAPRSTVFSGHIDSTVLLSHKRGAGPGTSSVARPPGVSVATSRASRVGPPHPLLEVAGKPQAGSTSKWQDNPAGSSRVSTFFSADADE